MLVVIYRSPTGCDCAMQSLCPAGVAAQETATGDPHGDTFILATYVKYLEQAGARVVPVRSVRLCVLVPTARSCIVCVCVSQVCVCVCVCVCV